MSTRRDEAAEFVQLLREFLSAHAQLSALFTAHPDGEIPFNAVRDLVGDDENFVLFRLKERSHSLFRVDGREVSAAVRREALFDLAVGSLFHESMKLRESLYQREVYAPRIAELRDESSNEADALFVEFERILGRSALRLGEVVAEVRILLAQTRDQLRRLLVERRGDRVVTRFLLSREDQVGAAFPEGLDGLLEAMHGDPRTGRIEAARSLLESAYFTEAMDLLRKARAEPGSTHGEIGQLLRYASGMQAILDGDYAASISHLEGWADSQAHQAERDFARLASAALSRIGRLVADDDDGAEVEAAAKQLQLRLEAGSA